MIKFNLFYIPIAIENHMIQIYLFLNFSKYAIVKKDNLKSLQRKNYRNDDL